MKCADSSEQGHPKKGIEPFGSYDRGRGKLYIITEAQHAELGDGGEGVVVVLDKRAAKSDPNMQIRASWRITSEAQQREIAKLLLDYNKANPVTPPWKRTLESIVSEWQLHNLAYSLGYKRDHSADCDLNNNDEGKTLLDLIGK